MVLDVSRSLSRSALARRPVALAALLLLAGVLIAARYAPRTASRESTPIDPGGMSKDD